MQGVALLIQFLGELAIAGTCFYSHRFGLFIDGYNFIEIGRGNLVQRTVGNIVETVAGAQGFLLTQLFDQCLHFFNCLGLVEVFGFVGVIPGPVCAHRFGFCCWCTRTKWRQQSSSYRDGGGF